MHQNVLSFVYQVHEAKSCLRI